jgi:hypothetical protein
MSAVLEGRWISDYAYVSTFQGQRYQITLRSALLSGEGISDYTVSTFGGEGYQVTHFAAAKAQSAILVGVSGYNKISDFNKNIRLHAGAILHRYFRRHFASITSLFFLEFVQVCASFCNISILSAMLPDLTGNVNILALSNRQLRQHFERHVARFNRQCQHFNP